MSAAKVLSGVLSVMILCGLQQPASAHPGGDIHLVVRVGVPHFGDRNDLIYQVEATNLGPERATGLEIRQSTLVCATRSTPLSSCQRIRPMTFTMADLGRGGTNVFPVVVLLPGTGTSTVVVRTTVEVSHADQRDRYSLLGGCRDGLLPQDACGTRVSEVLP